MKLVLRWRLPRISLRCLGKIGGFVELGIGIAGRRTLGLVERLLRVRYRTGRAGCFAGMLRSFVSLFIFRVIRVLRLGQQRNRLEACKTGYYCQ